MKTTLLLILIGLNVSNFSQKTDTIARPVLYLYVDEMPEFQGGQEKLKEFIDHNINWPGEFDGEGTVLTSFIITQKGEISSIKIEKGLYDECNNEAIRIIKLFPKWTPGKLNTKNVDVLIYLPIRFKLSN